MTATVSAIVMASSWSWVTCTKVRPTSVWIRLISICIEPAQLEVQGAERLVEQQHLAGWLTRARARATRCCCPPESWAGFLRAWLRQLDQLEHLGLTWASTSDFLRRRSPKATFSKMSRCGKSA